MPQRSNPKAESRFKLRMSRTIELKLPAPHSGQQTVIQAAKRFNVVCCGRRWGKTVLGLDRLIQPALRGLPVAWFSPSYKYLADAWRELTDVLRPVTADANKQERHIDLIGGGSVEAWSLDSPDAGRGRKYKCVVIDEAAMVSDLETAWQQSIRPTLTDLQGDAWFLSTPKGINSYFAQLFNRGKDPEQLDWASWQAPTAGNPFIPPDEIEAARRDMSDLAFAQEYEGRFVSWEGAIFRRIVNALLPGPPLHGYTGANRHPGWRAPYEFVIGVDWGRTNDFTVFTVACLDGTICEIDRFRGLEYSLQRARLFGLRQRYQPSVILAEANAIGGPVIEQLRREGMTVRSFTTTNATKAEIIDALALAFEKDEIRIPEILNRDVLVGELQAYEAKTLPSGLIRYSAPDAGHDDTVMSLALAWRARKIASPFSTDPASIAARQEFGKRLLLGGFGNPWQ